MIVYYKYLFFKLNHNNNGDIMNDEKFLYKASDLTDIYGKSSCNEYGINLGSNRRKKVDIFENALKLKRFKNEEK